MCHPPPGSPLILFCFFSVTQAGLAHEALAQHELRAEAISRELEAITAAFERQLAGR